MPKTDNVRQVDLPRSGSGGSVYIRGGNAGGVSNADTVDGYHASSTPTAGKLLALDASAQFDPSVIEWADVAGAGLDDSGNTLVVLWGNTPTTIQPDDVAAGGSAAASARSDHRHAIATAVPGTILPDDSANEGSATSFARSDHRHAIAAGAPGSISPDDAAAEGTATTFARSDHRHAITAAAPAANLSASTSNAEGSASSFSRSDHSHALTAYSDASVYPGHLLKGDASGDLKVRRLEASDRLIASLVTSAAGLTLQPTTDLVLDPNSNLAKVASGVRLQSDGYVSQTTGWGVAYNGAADFRYLYTDELHAKAFIADLEQALAGGQIIAKSVAPISRDFTAPAAGATAYLWVECFQGFPAAEVFQTGDVVMVRTFDRSGGGLSITNCFGTVSAPYFPSPQSDPPEQRWTFTRLSGTVGGHPAAGYMGTGQVVRRGTLALDFGVSGNGYYEVSAIDGAMGANSPYAQIVTWNAHPWYDRKVRTRYGNLYGVFATAGEYGMFAGNGAANADQFLRLSNSAIEGHNLPIRLYDGATQVVRIEPNSGTPYIGLGNPAPTAYLGASGIWLGKHSSAYKAHVGTVSGGDVTAGWKWDGTTLTVRGQIYVTGGDAAKTDLSNVGANVVSGKVNADSTLIQPGRILISGSTTLDDWRHPSDTTLIDGGDIYAGSITAEKGTFTTFNLVDNPGFEFPSVGWALQPGASFQTDNPRSGSRELRYSPPSNGEANVATSGYIPVRAGQTYYAEVYCHATGGAVRTMGVRLAAYDKDKAYLRRYVGTLVTQAGGGYTKRSALITVDSDVSFLRVELYVGNDCVTGTQHYWDDVVLREATGMNVLVGVPGGARVEINSAGVEGYSDASTRQFYLRTSDGRGMFGGGKGILDRTGLMLSGSETALDTFNSIRWLNGTLPSGTEVARLSAGRWRDSAPTMELVVNDPQDATNGHIGLTAKGKVFSTHAATMYLRSWQGSPYGAAAEAQLMTVDDTATCAWVLGQGIIRGMIYTGATGVERMRLQLGNSAGTPTLVLGGDTDTGFWQSAANNIDIATGGANRVNISSAGLDTTGQVNRVYPHIILPSRTGSTKTSTTSYQIATYAWQSFDTVFEAIAGRGTASQSNWKFYWIVTAKFPNNTTKLTFKIVHYTGGAWTDLVSTTYERYAAGLNMIVIGPATLTGLSQTMRVEFRQETANSGQIVGEADGGVSALLFVRS